MKIYRKIVISMVTGQVVEEDSFDYQGPVAQAKGGGGASGAVDYPEYQKQIQAQWLAGGDYDDLASLNALAVGNDITSLLNEVIGHSPYAGLQAYDPATRIAGMEATVSGFLAQIQAAVDDYETGIDTLSGVFRYARGMNDYGNDQSLEELEDYLESLSTTEQIENELGQFSVGMDNIGAVGSSAWLIGKGIIASGLLGLKLDTKLKIAQLKDQKARFLGTVDQDKENKISGIQADAKKFVLQVLAEGINRITGLDTEVQKLAIIALKEQAEGIEALEKNDSLWDLTVFGIGANVMASISGGTVSSPIDGPSHAQSAIAGGLSGAAGGAMLGVMAGGTSGMLMGMPAGPVGAAAGALIGIGSSFL